MKSQYVEINLRFYQIALSLNKRGLRKGRTEEGGRRAGAVIFYRLLRLKVSSFVQVLDSLDSPRRGPRREGWTSRSPTRTSTKTRCATAPGRTPKKLCASRHPAAAPQYVRRNKMPVPSVPVKLPSPLASPEGEQSASLARTGTDSRVAPPTRLPSEELRRIRCSGPDCPSPQSA